jgi:HAD superfamily hydrolase (TIGR01509 family)
MIQAVIFDCDGVMFDTIKANTAYYNRMLAHFGRPEMTRAQFDFVQMHTVGQSIAFLFEDDAAIRAAETYRDSVGYDPFYRLMEIEPDLRPLLKIIRPRFRVAIATNRSDTIDRVLSVHGLKDDFELVISALDVRRPKPYPDPLLKITEYFNLKPDQAIYIGDSKLDEQAARAAGMPLVAYRNRSLTADAHIDRLMELAALLEPGQAFPGR